MSNYNNIFAAHRVTQQTVILHGSSGFGKTSTVREYVKASGAVLIDKRLSMIDPLTMFLPYRGEDGAIHTALAPWVQQMVEATVHTVVFFDEITNPSSPEVFNVMKEILGERTILGLPISKHVQFIGASNLMDEDTGVKEMPDSLWKRATHLSFTPSVPDILSHLGTDARKFFAKNSSLLHKPALAKFPLHAAPRQVNACLDLFNTGVLTDTEFRICCIGRIGEEAGIALATHLSTKRTQVHEFPEVLTKDDFDLIREMETIGRSLEVTTYLKQDNHDKAVVAEYLAHHGSPEVCRIFHEAKVSLPVVSKGDGVLPPGLAWPAYAANRNALVFKNS